MISIGLSGNIMIDTGGMFPGNTRTHLFYDYISAMVSVGISPLMFPVIKNAMNKKDLIFNMVKKVNGVILTGGADINPLRFGQEPHVKLGDISDERDDFDCVIIEACLHYKKPILGICRGAQILNVYFGGNIYQDIHSENPTQIKHWQNHSPSLSTHTVLFEEVSFLRDIYGEKNKVNSFHHQAIDKIAPKFKVIARATDGIIEAIEYKSDLFICGVQWHPEMQYENEYSQKLFNYFKKICGNKEY